MAGIEHNLEVWSSAWDWSQEGDEWSAPFGGTPALWHGALLPRIQGFVPAERVLEIAPGFGRWTQYLKDLAGHLIAVDLTERCVEHCRERFAGADNLEVHANDGRSLPMVEDRSIDFAFSFDSLVHAEADVLGAYARELARTLADDGVAFIHHSNIGAYPRQTALARRVPGRYLDRLVRAGLVIDLPAWRAESVTAESFARQCAAAGLACVRQEKIAWVHGRSLIDCLSVVARRGSRWDRTPTVVRNRGFRDEAQRYAGR